MHTTQDEIIKYLLGQISPVKGNGDKMGLNWLSESTPVSEIYVEIDNRKLISDIL